MAAPGGTKEGGGERLMSRDITENEDGTIEINVTQREFLEDVIRDREQFLAMAESPLGRVMDSIASSDGGPTMRELIEKELKDAKTQLAALDVEKGVDWRTCEHEFDGDDSDSECIHGCGIFYGEES